MTAYSSKYFENALEEKVSWATLAFLLELKEIIGLKIISGILDSFSDVIPAFLSFLTLS